MPKMIPLSAYQEYSPQEMQTRAQTFYEDVKRRRTVRQFSPRPIPDGVIEKCIRAAGTAPSGANLQPWHFVVVRDPARKRQIREAAEEEEHAFYSGRAPQEWLDVLEPLGVEVEKPYLETAPCLIAIFSESYRVLANGERGKNYYSQESTGIATGLLITALHHAGLATLTHTPSPMNFLNDILERPKNERPFLLLVAGYPASDAEVPDISKKTLQEIATFL
jgi:nitroreductase